MGHGCNHSTSAGLSDPGAFLGIYGPQKLVIATPPLRKGLCLRGEALVIAPVPRVAYLRISKNGPFRIWAKLLDTQGRVLIHLYVQILGF